MRGTLLLSTSDSAFGHSKCPWCEHTFCPEEFAGDVKSLASYYHDLLTIEELLSHSAGQATQEMSLAIDNDLMSNRDSVSLGARVDSRSAAKPSRLKTYNWFECRHPGVLSLNKVEISARLVSCLTVGCRRCREFDGSSRLRYGFKPKCVLSLSGASVIEDAKGPQTLTNNAFLTSILQKLCK